ncbi:hypothetical protein ScPMuIL_011269 [Solemya velum]
MDKLWYSCCSVLLLFTGTYAGLVSNDVECGGATGNDCDVAKGLFCDKLWENCEVGVCACKPNTIWDDGKCKTALDKDATGCTADAATKKCKEPYTCTNNACVCPAGETYNADYPLLCLPDAKKSVGGSCATNDDCESNFCDTDTCACKEGYIAIESTAFCKKPAVGEACVPDNNQCIGTNIACPDVDTDICACTADKIDWLDKTKGCKVDGAAIKDATCTNDDSCAGNSLQCLACGKGTADTAKKCRAVGSTTEAVKSSRGEKGEECGGLTGDGCDTTKNLKCITTYDSCTIGKCGCETGYSWSGDKCKKVLRPQVEDCSVADTVCPTGLTCKSNKCDCDSGTYDEKHPSLCLAANKKLVGGDCDSDGDCQSGKCTSSKCACPAGQQDFDGTKYCREPKLDEACDSDSTCQGGSSVECPSGTGMKCSCKVSTQIPWVKKEYGCKVNGAKKLGEVCVDDDACDGNKMRCLVCGDGAADPTKKCRNAYTESHSGATSIKLSAFVLFGTLLCLARKLQ